MEEWQARRALDAVRRSITVVELFEERVGDSGLNIDVLVARRDLRTVLSRLDQEAWRYRVGTGGPWRLAGVTGYLWPDGSQIFLRARVSGGPLPPWWYRRLTQRLLADSGIAEPANAMLYLAVQALRRGYGSEAVRADFSRRASEAPAVAAAEKVAAECRLGETLAQAVQASRGGQWRGTPHADGRGRVARTLLAVHRRIPSARWRALIAGELKIGVAPVTARIAGVETFAPSGVFVPTPDAEALVDMVLADTLTYGEPVIVDCGTGNGAIALGVARHRPEATVFAIDTDRKAIRSARRAATSAALRNVTVLEGSLLDPLPVGLRGRVGVLVANLPFYPADRYAAIGSVEESTILGPGADGLDLYRRLLETAQPYLADGAVVLVQMFRDQWDRFAAELPHFGLSATRAVESGPFALGRATTVSSAIAR